jgi:hypothetical protein
MIWSENDPQVMVDALDLLLLQLEAVESNAYEGAAGDKRDRPVKNGEALATVEGAEPALVSTLAVRHPVATTRAR